MDDPLLVSIHIPKTAGSTLLRVFAERFGDRFQRAYRPPMPGLARNESDGWPDIERPLCIHGHAVFDRFPWVRDTPGARFITFLRDPLAGAVSLWRYQRVRVPWDNADPAPTGPNESKIFCSNGTTTIAFASGSPKAVERSISFSSSVWSNDLTSQ